MLKGNVLSHSDDCRYLTFKERVHIFEKQLNLLPLLQIKSNLLAQFRLPVFSFDLLNQATPQWPRMKSPSDASNTSSGSLTQPDEQCTRPIQYFMPFFLQHEIIHTFATNRNICYHNLFKQNLNLIQE